MRNADTMSRKDFRFIIRTVIGLSALVGALALSAWAGARWQANRLPGLDGARAYLADLRQREQAAFLAGGLGELAGRLGELQGRLMAMEAVHARMARAVGLDDLMTGSGAMDTDTDRARAAAGVPGAAAPDAIALESGMGPAQQLGQGLDRLGRRLEAQEDAHALLDAAVSGQSGFQASLPTMAPVDAPALSSSFGWRRNPVSQRQGMHEGLDFKAPHGAPIRAASGGLVVRAGYWGAYGRMVEIDHGNGLRTRYAHASRLRVKQGDIVQQGQEIAAVGSSGRSTGPHLHFEVRMADYPLDPGLFLQDRTPVTLARAAPGASQGALPSATDGSLR